MKNKKLLGALVALGGSILAIGSAFALYTGASLPENKDIIIGTKVTGDVVLHASVTDADTAHATLTPENLTRTVMLKAGFTAPSDSVYIQDYYYAKLTFKVASDSTDLIDAIADETWVKLGTQEVENNTYGTYWKDNTLNGSNKVVAVDNKSVSWSMNYPLFKGEAISQFEFRVQLKHDISAAEYLAIAEQTYTVDFEVEEADEEMAYVVGTAVGGWEDRDEFRMTINAKESFKQYMFKTGTEDNKSKLGEGVYKLHKGSTYCCGGDDHVWDSADNGKTFYWNGTSGHEGNFSLN